MKKVKTAQQFIPKKFSPPPVNTEFKFGIELKEIQGKMNFEPAFVITMTGEKASINL